MFGKRTLGLVVLALILVFGVAIASCGETEEGEEATTTDSTAEGSSDEVGDTETTGADKVDFDLGVEVIKIGNIAPYSGAYGFFGSWVENSMQVEIDRINAEGGLGGARLEVVPRDMELNPQLAIQAAQELVADKDVHAVVGPTFTGPWNVVKRVFTENRMISFASAVGGVDALDNAPYSFRTQESYAVSVPALLDYFEAEGIETVAVVYESDDTGKSIDELLEEHASEYGIEYLGFEPTRPDDQTHRPQVQAVSDADCILISNNSTFAAKTAAAAAEIEYEGQLAGLSGLAGYTYVEGAGDSADGTLMAGQSYVELTDIPIEEWPEGERRHQDQIMDRYGAMEGGKTGVMQPKAVKNAGDAVALFAMGVEKAESLDPDEIVSAMETLNVPAGVLPSGVNVVYGSGDHESYAAEDIWIYEWTRHDDGSWYLNVLQKPEKLK